ncbi:MAG: hypothetical protein HQ526_00775, partial [Actinobacteria bacterium]|nr:hypothetical protein [Actinomycetota bacterium]
MDSGHNEILLGAYAARRCPRRVHNDFDRTIPVSTAPFLVSATSQERMDAGRAFEVEIKELLVACHGSDALDIGPQLSSEAAIRATEAAMSRGIPIILSGWLPNDYVGGRKGRPDVLLRTAGARPDWRYVPVDIKRHKTLTRANKSNGDSVLSELSEPTFADARARPELNQRRNRRDTDTLQLAHYWRMLQACGRAPDSPAMAGIIGSDLVDGRAGSADSASYSVSWYDLDKPIFRTFSQSETGGIATRTPFERYDHEMAFRLEIAQQANQRVGAATDPLPLVKPIWVSECEQCPWQTYCAAELGQDNASLAVGRLDARSWIALADVGVSTVEDLAALDPRVIEEFDEDASVDGSRTSQVLTQYLPQV